MKTSFFNRKGAKNAKGFFVGLLLILEEKGRISKTPSPDGPIAMAITAARHVFFVFLAPKENKGELDLAYFAPWRFEAWCL